MVELAIALTILAAIIVPFFYYGVFITDLAAWKSTLYLEARDQSMGGNGKFFEVLRYTLLINSRFKSKNLKNKVRVEGATKILDPKGIMFLKTHKFEVQHERYKEDKSTYNSSWLSTVSDWIKRGWNSFVNLVKSWWERLFS